MRRRRASGGSFFATAVQLIFLCLVAAGAFLAFRIVSAGKFDRFDRFNVVVSVSPVVFLSADITEKSVTVVKFPDDLYMTNVYFGYGPYRISSVYRVGQLDRRGGETLAGTVREYLGVPVDGYSADGNFDGSKIESLALSPKFLLGGQTNVGLVDRFRLAAFLLSVRQDKITIFDLGKWSVPLVLADGSTARTLDRSDVDNFLSGDFAEERIRKENLRVEVLNSTGIPGLANQAARVLENAGITVISVGDTNLLVSGCQMRVGKGNVGSVTVKRIADVFSCQVSGEQSNTRADLSVIVGTDYAKSLGKL